MILISFLCCCKVGLIFSCIFITKPENSKKMHKYKFYKFENAFSYTHAVS